MRQSKTIAMFGLGLVAGSIAGLTLNLYRNTKALSYKKSAQMNYALLNHWLYKKHMGLSPISFLREKSYKSIAIYGVGMLSELLLGDINKSDIKVAYIITSNGPRFFNEIPVISPDELINQKVVDAIIITETNALEDISDRLHELALCPVYSLSDILK